MSIETTNKQPMSTAALLRYMRSCCDEATCSITLIDKLGETDLDHFEFQWALNGKIKAIVLSEGNLYRDDRQLQRSFNSVRAELGGCDARD